MYVDKPIREYLDDLSARRPVPGGGSAAALAGALGTSLMMMVGHYTLGVMKYKDNEAAVKTLLAEVRRHDARLRELVDEDAEAYGRLSAGLKACGSDISRRDELYKQAVEPPFAVCEISARCLDKCKELAIRGNRSLVTDTAIAAHLFECAFFSAKFNVYINLECVKDIDFIAGIHKVLLPLEERVPELKSEVVELCEEVIDDRTCP
jgi:formiminotetrahydrofolate cyclodeaminase